MSLTLQDLLSWHAAAPFAQENFHAGGKHRAHNFFGGARISECDMHIFYLKYCGTPKKSEYVW